MILLCLCLISENGYHYLGITNPEVYRTSDPSTWRWVDGDPFNVSVLEFLPIQTRNHDGLSISLYKWSETNIKILDNGYDYQPLAFTCEIDCDNIGRSSRELALHLVFW